MKRRGLILGLGAFFAAPAIVRAASLMPVSVLKPEIIAGLDMGAADGSYIVIGRKKFVWLGKVWVWVAEPVVPHWSDALPQRPVFTGHVAVRSGDYCQVIFEELPLSMARDLIKRTG